MIAAIIAVAFLIVGIASYLILDYFIPDAQEDRRGPRALSLVPFALITPGDALYIWLAAAFGLGLLWSLWIYVGPWLLRRLTRLRPYERVYVERPRWEDGSPRVRVTDGASRLELIKGLRPGQQPDGGKR